MSYLNDTEGPTTRACEDALVTRVGDLVGLAVGGAGDVALEPSTLRLMGPVVTLGGTLIDVP